MIQNHTHECLKPKDICPDCTRGKLYLIPPKVVVVLTGHAPVSAKKHILEQLRCNLCGSVFTAAFPNGIELKKYDDSVSVAIALFKNYAGLPLKRLETLQDMVGVPLKDATQWDLMEGLADKIHPVFRHLEYLSAQGDTVHHDDTSVKILSLMKENKTLDDKERRGMFTTGILSKYQGHTICLYVSGRHHSGENMGKIMPLRAANLPPVIRMSDALSSNSTAHLIEYACKCLAHGRRKFVEILKFFPESCRAVIRTLKRVYRHDAFTRKQKMSNQDRLVYHQKHSTPIMESLKIWLEIQLAGKHVEPNSSLGKAIQYMLNHWDGLTQFLCIPGAPLDNNILERILKTVIRVRKNSLFYKTEHGAYIGGMFTSLIQTCQMNGVNPFDYLMCLTRNSSAVFKAPQDWLPWNYQETMERLERLDQKSQPPPNTPEPLPLAA
jgi:transposase